MRLVSIRRIYIYSYFNDILLQNLKPENWFLTSGSYMIH